MKRTARLSDVDFDSESRSESTPPVPVLSTLRAPVSPPPLRKFSHSGNSVKEPNISDAKPSTHTSPDLAAIEAGKVKVEDHARVFSQRHQECSRPASDSVTVPRISIEDWVQLYRRNEHPEGRHFVIHQHDHPVAGPHYDLRLQFSESSSVSWSIMYGLPGDPNSQRLNRNATETRVHCLWNHLIETASSKTGSLIIWDTGQYEILPYEEDQSLPETDDSRSLDSDDPDSPSEPISHSQRLKEAFRNRKIRLRLQGTRLPKDYTVLLRMDKKTDFARPIRNGPKRRRRTARSSQRPPQPSSTSKSDADDTVEAVDLRRSEIPHGEHSDNEMDVNIQKNNAYPGSSNTIGSIHQRKWYLSLARDNSGFERSNVSSGYEHSTSKQRVWKRKSTRDGTLGFDVFHVRGPEIERSIVTGRRGQDVLHDEEVADFQPRKGWKAILN